MTTLDQNLEELRANGFTVLHDVIDAKAIADFKEKLEQYRAEHYADADPCDGDIRFKSALLWSEEVARAVTHEGALWLLRKYLETEDIHYCHQPIVTVLKPASKLAGTFPESGWHSDYPYHPGVFPDEAWPDVPLGAQFNICIDPFTAESAGTQYVPGSHLERCWPPVEFNRGGTRAGEGVHKHVQQMIAPAGAAVIYDARTWHRACHELNSTGRDRVALLNAVAPAWVLPMMDKAWLTEKFRDSDVADSLTTRERHELDLLCHRPTQAAPADMPTLQTRMAARQRPV